jgi:protein-S-isoprenylcysteine O-methyltransferase Ste14
MKQKLTAALLGTLCHTLFALAIVLMGYDVYYGFTRGLLPIGGEYGRYFNLLLIAQFPIAHSLLLTPRGRSFLAAIVPGGAGKDLVTTTFATVASIQLLFVFLLWTPTETIWFEPHGTGLVLWSILFAGAWGLLLKALYDTSLALHSGFLGWSAVVRGKKPSFRPPPTGGLYQYVRHPIYLSFALILFLGPVWSPDHLWFAAVWGAYCIFGPILKERRLASWYGETYKRALAGVPYMIPRFRRNTPRGSEPS